MANTPRQEAEEKPGPRSKAAKKQQKEHSSSSFLGSITEYFNAIPRKRIYLGGVLLLFSFFLAFAFFSALQSSLIDQDLVIGAKGTPILEDKKATPSNLIGEVGAWLAQHLLLEGFGIASFGIVYLLLLTSLQILFSNLKLSLGRKYFNTLVAMVAISLTISYLTDIALSESWDIGGGAFGHYLTEWLNVKTGSLGTGFILLTFWSINFLVVFKINLKWPEKKETSDTQEEKELNEATSKLKSERLKEEADLLTRLRNEENAPAFEIVPDENQPAVTLNKSPEVLDFSKPSKQSETPTLQDIVVPELDDLAEDDETGLPPQLQSLGPYDPKLDLGSYVYPEVDLLIDHDIRKVSVSEAELKKNSDQIVTTLGHYDIKISKISATVGPTVTLYEIVPAPGIKISKIKNLEDDIALSLAALGIRIIAPMPGTGTIGIEVPNRDREMVAMRSMLNSEKFRKSTFSLPLALGKTIANEIYIADLAKMPHLLIAGSTGQGKSVGINAVLLSLIYRKHPAELKLILVDPKKVELSLFKHIERHFLAKLPGEDDAIITDTSKVVNTLKSLVFEMDRRYDLLKDAQARNITEYNHKFTNRRLNPNDGHQFLPFIVLVVDEFADLMMTAGKEVELPIARLAQLARAVGIHLIIATQRPSVNIITGTIKANFPARIAFKVTSVTDSRTILDQGGAQQLIGSGDMLLSNGSTVVRLQCPFVDTPEVEKVCEFIGSQRGYPDAFLLPEVDDNGDVTGPSEVDASSIDPLFEQAARLIVIAQQGSTSLLQRKLKLGYNRAGRLIDQLEAAGIVGSFEGSKAREVLIPDEYALEMHLKNFFENLK